MTRPNTFYVYAHVRLDDGRIFYIGKGSWTPRKAYCRSKSSENRNAIWRRIVEKTGGFDVVVIAEFFDEADAFAFESALIAEFGRRDRGGLLANLTDGGEGGVGRIVSDEAKRKRRETIASRPRTLRASPMKGRSHTEAARQSIAAAVSGSRHPLFGTSHSQETRARISASVRANHGRARPVIDGSSGVVYPSAREAARQLDINQNTLKHALAGRAENKTTLRYV